jgi:hypothetical protein
VSATGIGGETDSGDSGPDTPDAEATAEPTAVKQSGRISRRRLILVDALITVTTVLLVLGMFSVWANRLLLNPDNWSSTSTQLLQNPNIRSTTANYLVDQLYSNVNVEGLIKSGLPPQFQALAAPAAGALRNLAVQGTELALSRPRIQNLWAQANRTADQALVAIVEGGKGPVGVQQGVVTLDLGSILDNVAGRLGLPSNISSHLPPHIATLTVLKSDQLKFVQNVGNAIKGLALWLTILVPILYALAILLAKGHRRRTLLTIGFSVVVAGILVLLGRQILQTQIASSLTNDATLRPTIKAVIGIGTDILRTVAGAVIFVGLFLIAAAWFAGPGRLAHAGREALAPYLREHPAPSYAITFGLLVLLFIWNPIPATGTPAGMIVFTALALFGTFLLRLQTMEEFPDARLGATTERVRAKVEEMRRRRQAAKDGTAPAAGSHESLTDQLGRLAELRDHGALSPEEYEAAKGRLLGV